MRRAANSSWFTLSLNGNTEFAVYAFSGREAISEPYEFSLELVHPDARLDLTGFIGGPALLTVYDRSGAPRLVHGLAREMRRLKRGNQFTHYHCVIVPRVWFLDQNRDQRIFQHKSVPAIITQILEEQGFAPETFAFKCFASYPEREYCVQYGESDLYFISRLCEEEGIYYYFEHSENGHCLCFSDMPGGPDIPGGSALRYFPGSGQPADTAVIARLNCHVAARSDAVALREWNFEMPRVDLSAHADEPEFEKAPTPPGLIQEHYRYPHLYQTVEPGKRYAELQLRRELSFSRWIEASGDVARFLPGFVFSVSQYPRLEINTEHWWVSSVLQQGEQPQVLQREAPDRGVQYHASLLAIPDTTRFVPGEAHPKKRIPNKQTAIVTGPAGEEIYPDRHGRVKVQFFWDREGQRDENSSCWIRVSQGWAGSEYGCMAVPRIGQEVIVSFMEGDPDRPIITGRVYHAGNMPPYELPAHKSRSVLKSMSTPGGDGPRGFNEIRVEDKADEEEIYLHAEKDVNIHVKNDWKEHILRDRRRTVEGSTYLLTRKETHEILKDQRKSELFANDNLTVHGNSHSVIDGSWFGEAGGQLHLESGVKLVLEAGSELVLKAGGSWVRLSDAGVEMDGPSIDLNCGGSPGSATPSAPELPGKSKEVAAANEPTFLQAELEMPRGEKLYAASSHIATDASLSGQEAPPGTLTEKEAQTLFDELKNNPYIPFKFVSDCCFARAHEMCRIMTEKGISSGKTWYFDSNKQATLHIPNPNGTLPFAGGGSWWYHVAPTVNVVGKDGLLTEKVMDPSLFDGPVSIDEWHAIMDTGNYSRIIKNTTSEVFFIDPFTNQKIYDSDMSATEQSFEEHFIMLRYGKV